MYDEAFLRRIEASARAALPLWGFAAETPLRRHVVSENVTFLVGDDASGRMVLRVYRPGRHDAAAIRSELDWIAALRAADVVATPAPLPTRGGDPFATLSFDGKPLHLAAFAFMAGREPEPGEDLAGWFGALGGVTARLHLQSRGWARPNGFVRPVWDFDAMLGARRLWGDWRDGVGLDAQGQALLGRTAYALVAKLAAYGTGAERFGLVHADLRLTNLLVEGDRLGVIDFDDSGFGWFFYDFAAAASFMEHEPFVPELQAAWLDGYRTIAPVSPEDEAMLPAFLMARRMLLVAWVASHAETETAQAMGAAYTEGALAMAETFLSRG